MNEQTGGLGSSTPSTVPMKRKRGRPRKVDGVQGTNTPGMPGSSNSKSHKKVGTADAEACDDKMVGKKVSCVIEGTFNGGYLLNVQVAADTYLRGVVFRPERIVPVTPASDVAPQVGMIERTNIPIPVLNPESQIHSSVPLSGQCNKQPFEAKLQVPMSVDPVLPAEHSGLSVSCKNQSAPVVAPVPIMPKLMSKPRPERSEILIPDFKPDSQSQIHSSVRSSAQFNKKPFEAELPMPMSVDPVMPTELHCGISVSVENQSAPAVEPLADLPKVDSYISAGRITPMVMSKPGSESPPASIMSEFEGDKTIKQDETLHDVDAPRQAKESSADAVAIKDFQKTSEPITLIPTVENTEKELTTTASKLNELTPDEPKHSNCEIHQMPVSAEHQAIPSEHINNTVDNSVQMQGSLETGPESEPDSIMSEVEGDKTVKQKKTLHEVDVSRQAKESSAESINLVPTVENTEKELPAGQKSMPSADKLNELIPDESKRSITNISQISVSVKHESILSEQLNNTVDNFLQNQVSPEIDTQDTKSKSVNQTIAKVDTANSNGTPITDIASIPDEGYNHAVEFSHPPILYDKEPVPSESKLLSEGSDFLEMSDHQNYSPFGAVKNVDADEPNEVLATSLESENPTALDVS